MELVKTGGFICSNCESSVSIQTVATNEDGDTVLCGTCPQCKMNVAIDIRGVKIATNVCILWWEAV